MYLVPEAPQRARVAPDTAPGRIIGHRPSSCGSPKSPPNVALSASLIHIANGASAQAERLLPCDQDGTHSGFPQEIR
eukprot:2520098-Prymnesium_polylepis.1